MPTGRAGIVAWGGLVLFIVVGLYLAVAIAVGRQAPASATVEGVQIGGLGRDAAVARVESALAERATSPITVSAGPGGRTFTVDPTTSGLALDVPATVDGLTGFSLNPADIWHHVSGSTARPVRTRVDAQRLTAAVAEGARQVDVAAKDAGVSFATDGTATAVPATNGVSVTVTPTVEAVAAAYPRTATVNAEGTTTPPAVSDQQAEAVMASFVRPALSGPVTLVAGPVTVALQPAQVATTLSVARGPAGGLAPVVDKARLGALVKEAIGPALAQPKDARLVIDGDAPKVEPSVAGVTVDATAAAEVVAAALTAPDRTARLAATVAQPAVTTDALQALGVKELVASFDSRFPYNPDRTANLITAADTINGTLLKPGETFSLNGTLGERTADKGYREGYVIEDGRLVKGTGGGVSQISTVVYNLAWFSGATLVEHTSHTFYISRYPEGREATVYWPDLDNTFTNSTPHGMFIQMWVDDNQVHGRVWSTKTYEVESVKSARSNMRPGKVLSDGSTECVPQPEITPGFDVTVTRIIKQGDAVVASEDYTTRYQAEDKVVCTNPNHKN